MIANYGYEDGSGSYYISIDTDKCSICPNRGCINGCPEEIFEMEIDDWDNEIALIKESTRNELKFICAECKPRSNCSELLPCQAACTLRAIAHSW